MLTINRNLLPLKAHYFFFMIATSGILSQCLVFGHDIGISSDTVMFITATVPLIYIPMALIFGYLSDYYKSYRRVILTILMIATIISFAGIHFLPKQTHAIDVNTKTFYFSGVLTKNLLECPHQYVTKEFLCTTTSRVHCFNQYHYFEFILVPNEPHSNFNNSIVFLEAISNKTYHICWKYYDKTDLTDIEKHNFTCSFHTNWYRQLENCVYNTIWYWMFVILLPLGILCPFILHSISDAICFDILNKSEAMKYGAQRAWGTVGLVLLFICSIFTETFNYFLIIMIIFGTFDLISIFILYLPITSSNSILENLWKLLKQPAFAIFLVFCIIAGILENFTISFRFRHFAEIGTEYIDAIKYLEKYLMIAQGIAQIIGFLCSEIIITKLGYEHSLSLCFFTYAIRLILIALTSNPWFLMLVELIMQGCTYALCYTSIVAYASAIAPPGTIGTVQGLIAGLYNGLGIAIESFIAQKFYTITTSTNEIDSHYVAVGFFVIGIIHILFCRYFKIDTNICTEQAERMIPEYQYKAEQSRNVKLDNCN